MGRCLSPSTQPLVGALWTFWLLDRRSETDYKTDCISRVYIISQRLRVSCSTRASASTCLHRCFQPEKFPTDGSVKGQFATAVQQWLIVMTLGFNLFAAIVFHFLVNENKWMDMGFLLCEYEFFKFVYSVESNWFLFVSWHIISYCITKCWSLFFFSASNYIILTY